MSLLSPKSLHYIISISVASRILVFLIQLIANILVDDHNADAYRNRYHVALDNNNIGHHELPEVYQIIYKSIKGFTLWDAQYFLEISIDGYVSEGHLAFLPLYPTIINVIRQLLFEHKQINRLQIIPLTRNYLPTQEVSSIALVNYIRSAVIGFTVNNFVFFPLAAISLFALTKLVKRGDDKYAKHIVWWFCLNPASIFFSACYSESLFAALSFTGMFLIEYKADKYLNNVQDPDNQRNEYVPLTQLNRLLYMYLPCAAFFALSTAARSNGLVNIGFLCFQFLLKYAPVLKLNLEYWSCMMYLSLVLEFFHDILVLFMSSVVSMSGYITFQIYSYIMFCGATNFEPREKGRMLKQAKWCQDKIPHPYKRAQETYWNVGAFEYYEFKQVPNFLLALPITYIVLKASLKKSDDILKRRETQDKKQLAYYVQAIVLTIMCSVFAHVQITTRLLAASCPVVYWIFTDTSQGSRRLYMFYMVYCTSYVLIGTVLHSNFYPWT